MNRFEEQLHRRIAGSDDYGRRKIGTAAILLSCFIFSCAALLVKYMSAWYGGMFISLSRFLVGTVLSVVFIAATGRTFAIHDKKIWILRGIFGSVSMILFYIGIRMTSSGRASLLGATSPIFVAIFGYFFFGERLRPYNIVAILVGVAGAFFVFGDGSHYPLMGNVVCFLSGLAGGFAVNYTKLARERNSSFHVYLAPCLFGIAINFMHFPEFSTVGSLDDVLLLGLIGFLTFAGQVLVAFGYKYLEASVGRVFGMTETLSTVTLSFLIFEEEMPFRFFVGASVIFVAIGINLYGMREKSRT